MKYTYNINPEYRGEQSITYSSRLRSNTEIEYIDSGEYPVLSSMQQYIPDHWDKLYKQNISGVEYIWCRL